MCCMMSHGMNHGGEMEKSADEGGQPEPLLDVLQRRYALGEITQHQLEEMKEVLGLSAATAVGAAAGRSNPWEAVHHG
jgi:uncharacterized membrane protein